jgi:hypothetical protein
LGIGEAIITVLNEKGIPTPLSHVLLTAPSSRMDIISESEKDSVLAKSKLMKKYDEEIDRNSAYEILGKKMDEAEAAAERAEKEEEESKAKGSTRGRSRRKEKSLFDRTVNSTTGRTILREITRGIFGVLKKM